MPHHTPYDDFRIDCVQDVFRIARGGTFREELPLLCKCVHSQLGTVFKFSVGEPPDVHLAVSSAEVAAQLEAVSDKELQDCHDAMGEALGQVDTFGDADEKEGLDPATLALLLQLGMSIIKAIMERRKNRPQRT